MFTLLVAEDNEDNMYLLEAILEDTYTLLQARDGLEALTILETNKPDLILLDIAMPNMSGEEVLIKVKNDPNLKNIPVIALTAHAMLGDKEKYLKLGFDEYLSKPIIDEDDLLSLIKKYL